MAKRARESSGCACDRPNGGGPSPSDSNPVVDLGLDPNNGACQGVRVSTCDACGQKWLTYWVEDWAARSNRWYRIPVAEVPAVEDARGLIESAEYCHAGGEFHRPAEGTGKKLYLRDGTERRVEGFRMNKPVDFR